MISPVGRCLVAGLAGLAGLAVLVSAAVSCVPQGSDAGAATPSGAVVGEGGDAVSPILSKLLRVDAASMGPDSASYTNVDLDQGITDFVGSAPGMFNSDFAVSERQLTSAESSMAAANGRTFAYVPFAASPVALVTLVPNAAYTGSQTTIDWSQFCQHVPLSLDQLDGIYGAQTPPLTGWGDSRLNCTMSPNTPAGVAPFGRWATLDPTMESEALMSLLDSTTASKASFGSALATAQTQAQTSTSDPTPSEHWPYVATAWPGGDQAALGVVIGLQARSDTPSPVVAQLKIGAIMPVADDWTGSPLGPAWNLPTAAVQNMQGSYVPPSADAAKAAESEATLSATSDPTTNNLVTFNASSSDATAYNNWLMVESYLVVPTNGLPADKAQALAQLIRFVVGSTGQADISALGAAPATPAMVTADLAVAKQLDAEASTSSSTTTTTTTAATTATTNVGASPASSTGATGTAGGVNGTTPLVTSGSTVSGLAVTGENPAPFIAVGLAFFIFGEVALQFLRRRRSPA